MSDTDPLRARFLTALVEVGATRGGGALFDDLIERYREPQRHYHTLAHVEACLGWLDRFRHLAERPEEVELALWFHDAVYEPNARDNERRSAALARVRLTEAGVPVAVRERVARHVEATKRHVADSGDAALVVDLDLGVLAASDEDLARFEAGVRAEHARVPEPLYRFARRRVLKRFLARPVLYQHAEIRDAWEARARQNLARATRA